MLIYTFLGSVFFFIPLCFLLWRIRSSGFKFNSIIKEAPVIVLLNILVIFIGLLLFSITYKYKKETPFSFEPLLTIFEESIHSLVPEVFGALLVYVSLEKGLEYWYGIRSSKRTPQDIIQLVSESKATFIILDTFITKDLIQQLLHGLKQKIEAGIDVKILLLNPDANATQQRAEDLKNIEVEKLLYQAIFSLHKLKRSLSEDNQKKIIIRLYDASTSISFYANEKNAYCSFYPMTKLADDAENLKFSVGNSKNAKFGEYVKSHFYEIWNYTHENKGFTKRVIDIDDFIFLKIKKGFPANYNKSKLRYGLKGGNFKPETIYIAFEGFLDESQLEESLILERGAVTFSSSHIQLLKPQMPNYKEAQKVIFDFYNDEIIKNRLEQNNPIIIQLNNIIRG